MLSVLCNKYFLGGNMLAKAYSLIFRLFFKAEKSTFIVAAIMIVMLSAVASAADLPPPVSSGPGPGDALEPQPIPTGVADLSFLPTVSKDGITPAETPTQVASVLQIVGLLTFITLAPSLLLLMTAFTRIIIVLSFFRRAIGTQTMPPDQVMVGIALFLTVFVMAPTWEKCWDRGLKPYLEEARDPQTGQAMTQGEMFERILEPQRDFMMSCLEANNGEEELVFFMGVSGHKKRLTNGDIVWVGAGGRQVTQFTELRLSDYPTIALVPAFISSELKRGFWMGFLLYLPFLILDMVIASVLMSMGMMMLPPVMVSLPFKIVMFVLVDGWRLLLEALVSSFPPDMLQYIQAIT